MPASPPSILFAIPCYGGAVYDKCVSGLYHTTKILEEYRIKSNLMLMANESLISTGRSNIANFFLHETDYDYIMCIDADVGFLPTDILKLINANKQFVTGAYSMKTIPPRYNFHLSNPVEWEGDLIRVAHIGTGFQMIHRSVFEEMSLKFPELKYTPTDLNYPLSEKRKDNSYHFYDTMIDEGIIPEDISFCRRWNSIGGKIWLDTTIELTHSGNHVFAGIPDLSTELKKATLVDNGE